ncbi:hypothetical protein MFIFM68171_10240 [Madurella fahalii]|uniref:Dienelactone hydrolase domain-containing protein n=1 Tax=Madurella fahalii TaxID=1157608 RepID=A0ABQ0GQL9_9PEZI
MRAAPLSILSALSIFCGSVVASNSEESGGCQAVDASILANTGEPVGEEIVHNNITIYISRPDAESARAKARAGTAVLFLTDVFGIALPENKLLVDSFARAGYLTVAPDYFNGSPAPGDINVPGFNTTEFLARHNATVTDPIIATTIEYLRTELNVSRIGAPGYCFGGRYAFRFLAEGHGVDVAYAAHPSLLEASEIQAIDGPVSVAAAERDALLTSAQRAELEALLAGTSEPYVVSLYSGTPHGFAVRANMSDPVQRFAKEEAFLQAVRWFDHFLPAESSA